MPDEAIKYYPSYGARQIAEATQGKITIGVTTGILSKDIESIAGKTGLPLYPLNTEFYKNKIKRRLINNLKNMQHINEAGQMVLGEQAPNGSGVSTGYTLIRWRII